MMENRFNKKPLFSLDRADIFPILFWCLIVFLTWLFMHGADHFLILTRAALGKYFELRWFLIAHITAGGGALVMGFIQFWPKLRKYSWKLHRVIGLLYLMAILVSSLCAMVLAFSTAYEVNWAYAFSLQVWVGVWISSTAIAFYAALQRKFQLHQEWMVRSYLVTLAFILSGLAIKLPFIQRLGSFDEISPSLFWVGWSVPLYIYQVILSSRTRK
ncbi:DUF2306 domain-containing protein [Dyadobacter sp. LJ53]|uniref:DUF2306 domain-containing protein n=1 Tax=Dyadobacter chenwenxiniae TaxID=2906456 RepID=UPI001F3CDC7C|nr:DUF2306 domain-containing protein [Dyadobacter chenwenxiniae]MCF0049107.1 DUF2306 domain-containing protein [Dyadobacter chenwenxiniae]